MNTSLGRFHAAPQCAFAKGSQGLAFAPKPSHPLTPVELAEVKRSRERRTVFEWLRENCFARGAERPPIPMSCCWPR